jgi:hypothetical protein
MASALQRSAWLRLLIASGRHPVAPRLDCCRRGATQDRSIRGVLVQEERIMRTIACAIIVAAGVGGLVESALAAD